MRFAPVNDLLSFKVHWSQASSKSVLAFLTFYSEIGFIFGLTVAIELSAGFLAVAAFFGLAAFLVFGGGFGLAVATVFAASFLAIVAFFVLVVFTAGFLTSDSPNAFFDGL